MCVPRTVAAAGLLCMLFAAAKSEGLRVDRISLRLNYVMDAEKLQRASAIASGDELSGVGAPDGIVAHPTDSVVVQVGCVDSAGEAAYPDQAMLRFVDVSKAYPQPDTIFVLAEKRSEMKKDVSLKKEVAADLDFWRHDAVYKVEVIVGDPRLAKSVSWTVTESFRFCDDCGPAFVAKPRGVFDFDMSVKKTLLPEFITALPEAEKEAPVLIVQAFTALSILPLLGLLWAWSRLGVFPLRLPSSAKEKLSLFLFQLCLVGHVAVLVMFWLKWNIVLTWKAIGVNMVPTLYFGHQILSAKATRDYLVEKNKET